MAKKTGRAKVPLLEFIPDEMQEAFITYLEAYIGKMRYKEEKDVLSDILQRELRNMKIDRYLDPSTGYEVKFIYEKDAKIFSTTKLFSFLNQPENEDILNACVTSGVIEFKDFFYPVVTIAAKKEYLKFIQDSMILKSKTFNNNYILEETMFELKNVVEKEYMKQNAHIKAVKQPLVHCLQKLDPDMKYSLSFESGIEYPLSLSLRLQGMKKNISLVPGKDTSCVFSIIEDIASNRYDLRSLEDSFFILRPGRVYPKVTTPQEREKNATKDEISDFGDAFGDAEETEMDMF